MASSSAPISGVYAGTGYGNKNITDVAGDDVGAIVIDCGSSTTKIGYAGEDSPKQLWNSAAGEATNRSDDCMNGGALSKRDLLQFPLNYYVKRDFCQVKPLFYYPQDQLYTHNAYLNEVQTTRLSSGSPALPVFLRSSLWGSPGKSPSGSNLLMNEDVFYKIIDSACSSLPSLSLGGLGVNLQEHPVLLSEPSKHNRKIREKMIEILFESYKVPATYVCKKAVLSAFGLGRANGLVVHTGSSGMCLSPVTDGFCLQKNILEYPVGGNLLDEQLSMLLHATKNYVLDTMYSCTKTVSVNKANIKDVKIVRHDIGNVDYSYLRYSQRAVVKDLKEAMCRVAEDDSDIANASVYLPKPSHHNGGVGGLHATAVLSSSSYFHELPDGTRVDPDPLQYRVPELLFKPELLLGPSLGENAAITNHSALFKALSSSEIDCLLNGYKGLPESISKCVNSCDVDIRRDLLSAIILTGGTALLPGLPDRLGRALQDNENLLGANTRFKIVAPSTSIERKFSTWMGGSILASLGTFQQLWFTLQEYAEHGAELAERKCA